MPRVLTRLLALLIVGLLPQDAGAQPSETSRLHWVTNGSVRAATVHEQTLYIGGSFTRVAPASSFLGPRVHRLRHDGRRGAAPAAAWSPV